jgi:hypothetical protein
MATTTSLSNNFRKGLMDSNFALQSDTIKCALYNGETHTQNTGAYTTTNEVPNGSGYTTAGVTMAGIQAAAVDTTNHVCYLDWTTNPSWATSTITATGCMIYDDTTVTTPATDCSIYHGDFSGAKSSSSGTFTVVLPAAAYNTAIVRLA